MNIFLQSSLNMEQQFRSKMRSLDQILLQIANRIKSIQVEKYPSIEQILETSINLLFNLGGQLNIIHVWK